MLARRTLPLLALSLPFLARASAPPVAVASFSILGDIAQQVAGQRWEIRTLAGPDVDAHHFQPRPSDAEALRGATVAIRNGAGFDGWFDRLVRGAGFRGRLVTATEGLTLRSAATRGGHSHGSSDPHAWQDARLATGYARRIAQALETDPAPYLARLAALDEEIRAAIATVPEERRVVVTSHDAFGYYGAAYGVRFLAPQGTSTSAEPSAQQVAALIRQIRQGNITAVFMENIGNPATLRRLAAEAGVQVRGRLFADALSPPDGPAATYEAMMRHNTRLLVSAMRNDPA
ncbi:metal ABC transporter solute-binding protein, Zn/Mn family [Sabulicella glaciei]|uniref:Zinc ABC transporter substrate-binding protein n=1 Tax=Sabulicella glaciei TaxID=2984948 RepID=A0ABT3NXI5_9PROT|nr:zinc ABC transporter substrate-binding protein [Roseococcus sp. MDT2-1-1]MCW8086883.1 zinc ABC transporter substrate-binding protein [Roseococcus sp. MDT2-1-1]